MRRFGAILLVIALAACGGAPDTARPALWKVEGPRGETAWLFGTIHALPRPVEWRSDALDKAFNAADRIVVEVDDLADEAAMAEVFTRLARSPGQPLLAERVDPALQAKLANLLKTGKLEPGQFSGVETWAAALMLARIGVKDDGGRNGIDRAVIAAAGTQPVVELEGAESQLGIFDALPEREQRDLLNAVVGDTASLDGESERLAETWRKGDMTAIEAETREGLLSDPELREALFTARNRAWADQLTAMFAQGARPFVAVGAAHLAGPEGLPAMLEAKGFEVRRIQ